MEKIAAREALRQLCDAQSVEYLFEETFTRDPLQFPMYKEKLEKAKEESGEDEACLCAKASIGGIECAVFAMDQKFMMGTLSQTVGERLVCLFEYAEEEKLPVVGIVVSGGARMQEGLLALMQMSRVSAAVNLHSRKKLLYISILKSPTLGGAAASFALQADVIMADPDALIGFTGAKVISQVTGDRLPDGFQRAEFMQNHGFVDLVVEPEKQRETVAQILAWNKAGKRSTLKKITGRMHRNG